MFWQNYFRNTRQLFKLSGPIFISQLSISGMGLADIVMAGMVSDDDISAIAVSNSIYFPFIIFILGLLNALTPTVSYLNGAKQRELIAHQIRQGGWIVAFFAMPVLILLWNSHWVLDFMHTPESFSLKSQQYLLALSVGLIPSLLTINLRCMNDGLSNPKPAMAITFIGLLANIILNYLFIFGKLGLPALGAVGCGVATAIVNWLMFGLMVHYCATNSAQKDIKLFEKWVELPNFKTLAKLLKLGLPIGAGMFTEVLLFTTSALLLAPLGSQVVTSHQVALQTSSLFFMLPLSFGIATTIMTGSLLGQKQVLEAKYLTYHALISASLVAIISSLIIALASPWIPLAFTHDSTSITIAAHLLLFAAIYQIPDSLQVIINGILRGYKYTKPIFYTTLFCYWFVGMPLGYILALTDWLGEPMAAQGFWISYCVSLTLASGLLFYQMYKIQRVPAEELLTRLERIK